ncbi:HNH endonuclease [Anaerotignum sp. MB30-C6]|uniref:HNH endonuclease n=1 Tax=Anaerotignum sp. MB30-C6 TaxID=3070814 RepID=UPI0027DE117D|nr:HNH endonuclease [Anaerotignum sp. MB30-C6]WMI81585.1 HNH endonuclease [Anaerotignum sp. MB30-C6]
MLKSCRYCGKIHDSKVICSKKPIRKKFDTEQSKFRSTNAWTKKSKQIKQRDGFLCQICLRKRYATERQYNTQCLEVHHIIKIKDDYGQRLEDSNLLTLCERHHSMADAGVIPAKELKEIAEEQEEKSMG